MPSDASGMKLRTMENKVHMAGYKTFGVLPTPMAFPELFTALQQGTVDGQENPIPVILASKFAQVQKYLSLTSHVYSPAVLIISRQCLEQAVGCRQEGLRRRRAEPALPRSAGRSTTTRPTASRS